MHLHNELLQCTNDLTTLTDIMKLCKLWDIFYIRRKMKFKSNIYIKVPLKMVAGSSSPRRQNLLHGAKSTESTEPPAGCKRDLHDVGGYTHVVNWTFLHHFLILPFQFSHPLIKMEFHAIYILMILLKACHCLSISFVSNLLNSQFNARKHIMTQTVYFSFSC